MKSPLQKICLNFVSEKSKNFLQSGVALDWLHRASVILLTLKADLTHIIFVSLSGILNESGYRLPHTYVRIPFTNI